MTRADMRVVEVLALSAEARRCVGDVLDDFGLDYVVSDETTGADGSAVLSVPLPAHSVEPLQRRLNRIDVTDRLYTVVVDPETVVSTRLRDSKVDDSNQRGIARSELRAKADGLVPNPLIYILLTAISAVVATAGVLAESVAVLVGSMVIAPLIGPPMAASLATVIGDWELFVSGVGYQVLGGTVAVISAVGFASLIRLLPSVAGAVDVQAAFGMVGYTAPGVLLIVVALAAGLAGGISLSTTGTLDLVGVMIAAAVMPPIGVVGVGIAWGYLLPVIGATALVLVNLLSMNLAAVICLWYFGYHPGGWAELRQVRSAILGEVTVLIALILGLAWVLARVANGKLPLVGVIS